MIKLFDKFNIEDDWEELEEEEYEFASDGSVLYAFRIENNVNHPSPKIKVEERIVTTIREKYVNNRDTYIFYTENELDRLENEYFEENIYRVGYRVTNIYACYFNADSVNIAKKRIKEKLKELIVKYKQFLYNNELKIDKLSNLLNNYIEYRKNMDKFNIKDLVNNIKVNDDDYIYISIFNKNNEVNYDSKIIKKEDMDNYYIGNNKLFKIINSRYIYKIIKDGFSAWSNTLYHLPNKMHCGLWIVVRGDSKDKYIVNIQKKYSSLKSYFTRQIKSYQYSLEQHKSSIFKYEKLLLKLSTISLDEYF